MSTTVNNEEVSNRIKKRDPSWIQSYEGSETKERIRYLSNEKEC